MQLVPRAHPASHRTYAGTKLNDILVGLKLPTSDIYIYVYIYDYIFLRGRCLDITWAQVVVDFVSIGREIN